MNQINFKEYNNFINNHKYDMLHFIIYYNLKCTLVNEFEKLTDEEITTIISFIYDTYLKDENNIDLSHMCDVAMKHKNDIINNEYNEFLGRYTFTKWDLLGACYE